jgi:hypothetical protein
VLADVWQTVEKERANPLDQELRAPKRRPNAVTNTFMQNWLKNANPEPVNERKCLIDMDML